MINTCEVMGPVDDGVTQFLPGAVLTIFFSKISGKNAGTKIERGEASFFLGELLQHFGQKWLQKWPKNQLIFNLRESRVGKGIL